MLWPFSLSGIHLTVLDAQLPSVPIKKILNITMFASIAQRKYNLKFNFDNAIFNFDVTLVTSLIFY